MEVDRQTSGRLSLEVERPVRLLVETAPAASRNGLSSRPMIRSIPVLLVLAWLPVACDNPRARIRFELLVTDPTTLVPYSMRSERTDLVDLGDERGSTSEHVQAEEYVFTHGARPIPPGTRSL